MFLRPGSQCRGRRNAFGFIRRHGLYRRIAQAVHQRIQQRRADVAAGHGLDPGLVGHEGTQPGHGGLAVGAGNGHHLRVGALRLQRGDGIHEQVQFAHHGNATAACRLEELLATPGLDGHAGTPGQQIEGLVTQVGQRSFGGRGGIAGCRAGCAAVRVVVILVVGPDLTIREVHDGAVGRRGCCLCDGNFACIGQSCIG